MGRFAGRDILQRSRAFAVNAVQAVRRLPKDMAAQHLGLQLLRSATSVGANLHEADMADSVRDFCNKVNIAQKEASESVYWIGLLRDCRIAGPALLKEIGTESQQLRKVCRQIVLATRRKARL